MKKSVFIAVDDYNGKKDYEKKFTNNFLQNPKNISCPIIKNYVLVDSARILN